jgi:NADH-quinone oxidoreductase subunit G
MLKLDIDGRQIEVQPGATVMDAANRLGIYIPHFCYHKKLSIAANCRMCLVEIEKAPKPMPACATPATDGMKVRTQSPLAKDAQNGVMEFLLINHPLDCPICDQGGECQLQDLAVGYGKSDSRYTEEKRVVPRKELGPLVAAEEMARCIQCTRCVRFGQEIAGIMELGLIGRGEKAEIVAFVGRTLESELSGNMIDLCPVGALTSEPFRYKARNWELARRKSVSPHDALGSNLIVQVKQHRVMRVLPLENEAINECWLSDKDRFSYEGLDKDRLTGPMLKRDGRWREVEWQEALEHAAAGLKGREAGILASPHSTLEELFLAGRLAAATGGAADFRLRHSDFSADGRLEGVPWLGMPVAELEKLDRVLVVGSFLRKDHPLLAQRLRQAAKQGTQVNVLHSVDDDWLMPIANRRIVPPSELVAALASIGDTPIGESLRSGRNVAVLLGNFAQQHPRAAQLHAAAQALGYRVGFLGEAANSVGGYVAGLPLGGHVGTVLKKKALVILNAEPELDCADPQAAMAAIRQAQIVIALSPFRGAFDYADVLLPITPFTETGGTFVNTEGRAQTFFANVRPLGDARPGWKVLRVLGTLLGAAGFGFNTVDEVRAACLGGKDLPSLLSNRTRVPVEAQPSALAGIQRIAEVPVYFADPLVRRSPPLQRTPDAQPPRAWMNARLMRRLGVNEGEAVLAKHNEGSGKLAAALDERLPDECVRIAAAHPSTAALGPMFGAVTLQKLSLQQAA